MKTGYGEANGLYAVRVTIKDVWGKAIAQDVLKATPDEDEAMEMAEDAYAMACAFSRLLENESNAGTLMCFAEVVWHQDSEHSQIEASNALMYGDAMKIASSMPERFAEWLKARGFHEFGEFGDCYAKRKIMARSSMWSVKLWIEKAGKEPRLCAEAGIYEEPEELLNRLYDQLNEAKECKDEEFATSIGEAIKALES